MRMREPFNQIKTTYEKRTRAAKGLHTENLEDLISIQDPLPYFIEYPYRNFRREDDHVRRIGAAKRLVSVLAKAPLYLVIEELLHLGDPLGNEFLELLTGAAPSDGTLAGLHTRLFQRFGEAGNVKLGIFEELLQCIADNSLLMTMVEARNRYTHEPFDDHGFLQLMDNHAPRFVYALRGALKNCRFIVPINLRVEPDTNKKIVTAEDACNSDAYFRRVDLEVQQPLEKFPTGKLLAYRATPESTFVLNTLVRTEIVTEKIRDFQLFDRAKGEERVFSNVRRNLTT